MVQPFAKLLSMNWLAEPKVVERSLVFLAGNAPASSGYQPGALLLSYGTVNAIGRDTLRARQRPIISYFIK